MLKKLARITKNNAINRKNNSNTKMNNMNWVQISPCLAMTLWSAIDIQHYLDSFQESLVKLSIQSCCARSLVVIRLSKHLLQQTQTVIVAFIRFSLISTEFPALINNSDKGLAKSTSASGYWTWSDRMSVKLEWRSILDIRGIFKTRIRNRNEQFKAIASLFHTRRTMCKKLRLNTTSGFG